MFIVKYDALGNVLWAKSTGGTFDVYGCSISSDVSGNILVTGAFRSDTIIFGTTTLINAGSNDIFVVKYDASGNVLWAKSAGGASYDVGIGISTDANGNVLVTGYFDSDSITLGTTTLTNAGVHDIFIAKLDGTTGIFEQNQNNNLTLYPNPATNYLTINTNNNKKQVITISDITGKIIYSTTTLSVKTIINTKDFPQGVYAVQVQAGDAVQTRKIVVTR